MTLSSVAVSRHEKLMAKTAFFKAILKFCTTNKIFVFSKCQALNVIIAILLISNIFDQYKSTGMCLDPFGLGVKL